MQSYNQCQKSQALFYFTEVEMRDTISQNRETEMSSYIISSLWVHAMSKE